ncbi:MAG: hypothetical protein PHI30_02395 [Oscillibacter sp.]|nr:hypothetical protein [Oscillibacter sp.]
MAKNSPFFQICKKTIAQTVEFFRAKRFACGKEYGGSACKFVIFFTSVFAENRDIFQMKSSKKAINNMLKYDSYMINCVKNKTDTTKRISKKAENLQKIILFTIKSQKYSQKYIGQIS